MPKIICTTTHEIAGRQVKTTLGVVMGEYYFHGEVANYERALTTMLNEAELLEADAVIDVRLSPVVSKVSEGVTGIFSYGTAVKLA